MKVSINEIIKEVLEIEDVKNIDRVKKLYIKLGNVLAYDIRYLRFEDMERIYDKIFTTKSIEMANYQNKIETICKPIAEILTESINKIAEERKDKNMKAKVVGYEKDKQNHVVTLLTLGKRNYYLDLSKDLYRIQKNMRTKYFAPEKEIFEKELENYDSIEKELKDVKCISIPKEKQEKIDKKIKYLEYGIYTDDVIEMLKKEIEEEKENIIKKIKEENLEKKDNKIIKFKVDFIFKHFRNNYKEKDSLKTEELRKFYSKIFGSIFTKKEKDNINLRKIDVEIKDDKNIRNVDGIMYELEFIRENKSFYYNYDLKEKKYLENSKEELIQMENQGKIKYRYKNNVPKFKRDKNKEDRNSR